MATTLIDSVIHWRKKLDKNLDEDTILNVIRKLSKIPITLELLEVTHIGKTIRKLSKRDDIVGEKALAVLKKWREVFASATESSDKSSKTQSVSKKENIDKKIKSDKHDSSYEKTVHQKETFNHEHKRKHEKSSFSHNSSQQITSVYRENLNNVSSTVSQTSKISKPSIYTYVKNEPETKYKDYDPHADASEGYNPECPELFPGEKSQKTKKPDVSETHEAKPSHKHKRKTEEQIESSKAKKIKYEKDHSNSKQSNDVQKPYEKKEKHSSPKERDKDSSIVKKESCNKAKSATDCTDKQKLSSDQHTKKSKSKESSENSDSKCNKSKPKVKLNASEEFTSSEVRFEDCLGLNDIVTMKKKKGSKPQMSNKKNVKDSIKSKPNVMSTSNGRTETKVPKDSSHKSSKREMHVNVPKPRVKLDVVDIVSTLPEIQPNYHPLPQRDLDFFPKKKEVLTNEDAIRFTSSRREKTAVYSGRRNFYFTAEVPSLFDCCTRILIENIDAIEYLGQVPFYIVKPILEKCNPSQLLKIEDYNPTLIDSTNELWEIHCKRDYKLLLPEESETWRDLYLRAHDERERKLKNVTASISASMSKSNPVRQVKLAFVDSIAKPPRDVARRQAKNGTARPVNPPVKAGPSVKVVPKPIAAVAPMVSSVSSSSASVSYAAPKSKPKVAPLMAKTLKSMKQCFRR